MVNFEGFEVMLNRVMIKDNIGVVVLLEFWKELIEMLFGKLYFGIEKQFIFVVNVYMYWDFEYFDVKLVQIMMFFLEVKNIIDKVFCNFKFSVLGEFGIILFVLCVDFNFLLDFGVVEYLSMGGVEINYKDFKELRYNESFINFSCYGKNGIINGRIIYGFKLKSVYESGLMFYINYIFDFKGIIDYIFYFKFQLNILGILGFLDYYWLVENNISGCLYFFIFFDYFLFFV